MVGSGVEFGQQKKSCRKLTSCGITVPLDEESLCSTLNSVLPRDIREYFYFDGEQLLTYFKDSKRRNVKDNVYTIAQINILDEVKKHLKSTINYYKAEYYKKVPQLEAKEEKLKEVERTFEELKKSLM